MDQQRVDGLLRCGTTGALADIDDLGIGAAHAQDGRIGEMVMHDDIGRGDESGSAQCEKFGIAGAGADQMHGHEVTAPVRMAKPAMP